MLRVALLIVFLSYVNRLSSQCSFTPLISPSFLTLCPLSSDTLLTQSTGSYQWFKNGNPILNATSQFLVVSHAQDAGASFVVAVRQGSCTEASAPVQVSAYSFPPVTITAEGAVNGSACAGDRVIMRLNSPYTTNITWFKGGQTISGQTNDSLLVTQPGSYSALAYIPQCPANGQLSSNFQVTFVASPAPVIEEDQNTRELYSLADGVSFNWFLNDSLLSDFSTSRILPPANGNYVLKVTNASGCEGNSPVFNYTSFSCSHNPLVTPENLVLCPNNSDTLFTQPGEEFQWYRDGVEIVGATTQFYVADFFAAAGASYSVEVLLNGCSERSPEVLVDGWAFLPVTLISEPGGLQFCEGDVVRLEVGNPYKDNVTWYNGNTLIEGEDSDTLMISESGVYKATGFTSECPNYSETTLPVQFTFLPATVPLIQFVNGEGRPDSLICMNSAISYSWIKDGEPVGASSKGFQVTENGTYTVTVNYSNGCSAISEPYILVTIGIREQELSDFAIYPNPALDFIFLEVSEETSIAIYSVTGAEVYAQSVNSGVNKLSLEGLPAGIYFLSYRTGITRPVRIVLE